MKKVLISGISGGLGSTMAQEFLDLGYKIIGLDLKALEAFKDITYICDATDRTQLFATFNKIIEEHGVPDIVVNNLGVSLVGPLESYVLEDFDKVMRVNFNSVVDAFHFWLPLFKERGEGNLVAIASIAGHVPAGFLSAYCASKFALVGFVESIRLELAAEDSPVQLTLISPGFVDTPLIKRGEKGGFPEKLKFLLGDADVTAKEMVQAIVVGKSTSIPTTNGKLMRFASRWTPSVLRFANIELAKRMKDDFKK